MTKIVDLASEGLADLPATCRACVFWEVAHAERGPSRDGSGCAAKESAWQATQLEWGSGGKAAYVDGQCVGYAMMGPPQHTPRVRHLGWSTSDDAMVLATIWVDAEWRGEGIGRALLQACLSETHRRGAQALEAVAERQGVQPSSCVLPVEFLLANGFTVLHDRGHYPLLRLDLSQTVRWSLSHALDAVLERLGRRVRVGRPALPASRSVSSERLKPAQRNRYDAISGTGDGQACCASKK